ncbi:MAG: T9SS type A sorting domain-containing protein, partial [Ginsengibacter sp.]
TVATVPARNRQTGTYNWLDKKPLSGYNYYRVRAVDINGLIGYTQIVKVKMEIAVGSISIYPNPITNGIVNLQLTNQPSGLYYIKLTNPIGQTIMSKKITHTEGSSTEKIKWDYKLAHGMYQMEITKPSGDVHVIKVMY